MDRGEFVNLDKFDGCDYSGWIHKMKFLLILLNVSYVLDPNRSPLSEDHPVGDVKVIADLEKQRREDEALCYKYIKNSLSDRLCDLYTLRSNNDPRLLWKTLEMDFKGKEPKIDKHLVRKYLDFRIVDGKSIMEQVHELQGLVKALKANDSVFPSEAFQIAAIIAKLPPSWKAFHNRVLRCNHEVLFSDLLKLIQIEESAKNNMDKQRITPPQRGRDGPSTSTKLGVKPNINFKKTASLKHCNALQRQLQQTSSGSKDLNGLDANLADLVAHVNLSM